MNKREEGGREGRGREGGREACVPVPVGYATVPKTRPQSIPSMHGNLYCLPYDCPHT